MPLRRSLPGLLIAACAALSFSLTPASAQVPDFAALQAAQRAALARLAFMDGTWRGSAWTVLAPGEKHELTQTERVGPFLDGAVKVIEGRGYDAGGAVAFNAFGIVSFDPAKKSYSMRSYAMGRVGDFALTPTDSGFVWSIPAGPTTIRYTATIRGGKWHEIGERLVPDQKPVRFFEMNLTRIGDSSWPAGGDVAAK